MARYLITQSLLSAWMYVYDCFDGYEDSAMDAFLHTLRREPEDLDDEQRQRIQNGIEFERLVTDIATGRFVPEFCTDGTANKSSYGDGELMGYDKYPKWHRGASEIAAFLKGAQFQVKVSREIQVAGITFLVYGILDALREGVISDVKFKNKSFGSLDLAGNYLNSPQHPLYFFMVPEARLFRYMVSDGQDLYIEQYEPEDCPSAADLILQFVQFLKANNLLDTYLQYWQARS